MANERRLIDAAALKAELRKSAEYHEARRPGYYSAITHIDEQPTVDAVEVVRCKDCCYARGFGGIKIERDEVGICKFTQMSVEPEEFCSHGEPRAEGKQ